MDQFSGAASQARAAAARWVGTRPRRWLLATTLVLGLLAAAGLAATGSSTDRTFAALAGPCRC